MATRGVYFFCNVTINGHKCGRACFMSTKPSTTTLITLPEKNESCAPMQQLQSASRCPCKAHLRQPDTCRSFGTPPFSVFDVAMERSHLGDSIAPGFVQNGHVLAKL